MVIRMSNVAQRVADHRARRKAGLGVFTFEGDEIDVPEILVEAGFLDPGDVENRYAISQALTQWFDVIKRERQ
jgi:hypothetical protein